MHCLKFNKFYRGLLSSEPVCSLHSWKVPWCRKSHVHWLVKRKADVGGQKRNAQIIKA